MKRLACSLFFLLAAIFSFSQVSSAERTALIALFNATDGPNWNNNTNWNTAATVDNWYGITVSGGHVVEIDLAGNSLLGTIPASIGDLQWLQIFDLSRNRISGTIPEELYTILSLEEIILNANRDLSGTISASIGNLSNLREFSVHENQMTGPIPLSITTLSNLEVLSIYKNNLTGTIIPELGNLTSLTRLQIGANNYDPAPIPPELGQLVNLTSLWINQSNLIGTLPPELGNLVLLSSFYMDRNSLTGPIPPEYGNFTEASWFLWHTNQFTGTIPPELGNWTKCRYFFLNNNQLTGAIPPELGNMAAMEQLNLGNNMLTGPIPSELGNLSNATHLVLSGNELSGAIPNSLTGLNDLYQLHLSNNMLSGPIPDFTALTGPGFDNNSIEFFWFYGNFFQFGDFENEFATYKANMTSLDVSPQAMLDSPLNLNHNPGENITLTTTVPSGTQLHYTWYRNNVAIAGAPDSPNLDLTNIQPADAGTYHVEVTSDIVTDLILTRHDIVLSIAAAPPGPAVSINATATEKCDLDTNLITLTATTASPATGNFFYEWFIQGNTTILGTNATFDVSPSTATTYVVVVYDDGLPAGSNSGQAVQTINVVGSPQLDPIANVTACTSYTLPVINGTNISSTASYYDNPNGTGTNYAPGTTINFVDFPSYPVTLYAYDENTGTTVVCPSELSFSLTLTPTITADNQTNVVECNSFTLPALSVNNSYWSAPGGNGTNYNQGESILADATIYIYADNGGCSDESQFTVTINSITADILPDAMGCLDYILPSLSPNNSYYTQPNKGGTLLNSGEAITTTSTIYIYAEVGTVPNICADESSFEVTITGLAVADNFENVQACDSYTLPALSANNRYFDQMSGQGTEYFPGEEITTNMTLYIYAGMPGCSAETDFEISLDTPITVSELEDVRACENHVLPEISNGRYYTQPQGQGIELLPFGVISDTQTIYIFNVSGSCTAESEFTVTIDCSPPPATTCVNFPKFFTPNSDGANDFFQAFSDTGCTINGTVSIYNQYGSLLSQFDAASDSWDGTYNGLAVPSTDYWYHFIDSQTGAVLKGHFSLKR